MKLRHIVTIFALTLLISQSSIAWGDREVSTKASTSRAISRIVKKIVRIGVSSIPSTSSSVSSSSTSSLAGALVSGSPPTLSELADATNIEEIFWRSGVVAAVGGMSPSADQCAEFFSSDTDGESGGLGACHMAEGVGEAFETVLHSETSLCYLKNFPTQANLDAGAITLISGSFPGGNVTKLFAPGKTKRLVKVNITPPPGKGTAESLFIDIASKKTNAELNFAYRADLYFCPEGESSPRGFNLVRTKIKQKSGEPSAVNLKITFGHASDPFGGGASQVTFEGNLELESGSVAIDDGAKRTIRLDHIENSNNQFKSFIEIRGSDRIYLKRMGIFRVNSNENTVKDYVISNFSGSDVTDTAFLEGAFKGEAEFGPGSKSFSGAAEYRDTFYASAPESILLDDVQSFDLDTDEFYTTSPSVDVDVSKYSCSAVPDIELSMDGENDTLEQSLSPCFREFQNLQFCNNDSDVSDAQQNFRSVCEPGGPGGGGPGGGGP